MVATTTSLRWRSIIPVQPSLILYVVVVLVAIAIFYLNPFSSTSYCAKSQIPSHMPFTIFYFTTLHLIFPAISKHSSGRKEYIYNQNDLTLTETDPRKLSRADNTTVKPCALRHLKKAKRDQNKNKNF